MASIESFFDFAEEDYRYLQDAWKYGVKGNATATLAQNVCERYLKHLIDKYYQPSSDDEVGHHKKTEILIAHSLRRLINEIEQEKIHFFSKEERNLILQANGYYYSSRYPGEDSFFVNDKDMVGCMEALKGCRDLTISVMREHGDIVPEYAYDAPGWPPEKADGIDAGDGMEDAAAKRAGTDDSTESPGGLDD